MKRLKIMLSLCLTAILMTSAQDEKAKLRMELWRKELERIARNESLVQLISQNWPQSETRLLKKAQFSWPCAAVPRSPTVPTSVHALRPSDIDIIGAMGDSLTAGTGIKARNILGVLIQNRGVSWSGGGDGSVEEQITLPNVLKKYNPEVYGWATGNGNEDSKCSRFNVAVSGSTSSDLVDQARTLIDRMKNSPHVDFNNDWKLVTILSGGNDICAYCKEPDLYNAVMYRQNLEAALDILHAEMPRTLINLVKPFNIEMVREINKGLICSAVHLYVCQCAAFPKNSDAEEELIRVIDEQQAVTRAIASSGRYDTRDDFTVVEQPFFDETYVPRQPDGQPDLSYFAPDCFHLSSKGQNSIATALWNSLIEPVNQKRRDWSAGEVMKCPDKALPIIFTNKNSNTSSQAVQHKETQKTDSNNSASSGEGGRHSNQLSFSEKEKEKNNDQSPKSSAAYAITAVIGALLAISVIVLALAYIVRIRRRHSYSSM